MYLISHMYNLCIGEVHIYGILSPVTCIIIAHVVFVVFLTCIIYGIGEV